MEKLTTFGSSKKLYTFITIALGIIIIVCIFIITNVMRERLNTNLLENYKKEELILAESIAKSLQFDIETTKNQLKILATDPVIQNGTADACNNRIKEVLKVANSQLGNVGRVDSSGKFRCSLNAALIGTTASNLGPYITTIFNDPEHNPVMSRAITVPNVTGYLAALHVPVYTNAGTFDGTIGGAIYFNTIQEKYLADVAFARRGYVVLIDDDGTILYHPKKENIGKNIILLVQANNNDTQPFVEMIEESKKGNSGTITYHSTTDGQKVAAYKPVYVVPGRVWVAFVTVPTKDASADLVSLGVDSLLNRIWIIVGAIVLLGVVAFLTFSNRFIFKPIKQVQEMKSDFVSLVSHQLKTPVAQIKGYIENMLDGLTGPINDKQKDYLLDMRNVAEKNGSLIDDLLNVSRIERRMLKVVIEPIHLNALLNDVLEPLRLVAKAKGVDLVEKVIAKDISISGDPVKTKEAIRNIVDNALKFTESGKKVIVSLHDAVSTAVVEITDQGPGVDPDVQKELFEKNRVWSGKVKASGAGLGLYLSKQFIELTGGTITFSTSPGRGTTFTITLKKV
jgi:signal transduction histidine kinase